MTVTYRQLPVDSVESGIFRKKITTKTSSKCVVHNKKPVAVRNLKVLGYNYTSVDPRIKVKLLSPPLDDTPWRRNRGKRAPTAKPSDEDASVRVAPGIVARWMSATEEEADKRAEKLGESGWFEWLVEELGPGEEIELLTQWETRAAKSFKDRYPDL